MGTALGEAAPLAPAVAVRGNEVDVVPAHGLTSPDPDTSARCVRRSHAKRRRGRMRPVTRRRPRAVSRG